MSEAEKKTKRRRAIAFYGPATLYLGFLVLFFVTRLLLVSLIFGDAHINPQRIPRQYNLIPFATIGGSLGPGVRHMVGMDVAANVLLFVPLGALVHALGGRKRVGILVLICLGCVLAVESLQFLLATGSFDVDDILTNILGCLLGVLLFHGIFTACKRDGSLARRMLSTISVPFLPALLATLIQYALWLPSFVALPAFLIFFAGLDTALYFAFFCGEDRPLRSCYLVACAAIALLFFLVVLPLVGP